MKLYELTLHITTHALQQYNNRVDQLERAELEALVRQQLARHEYRKQGEFIHIAGVWWIYFTTDTQLRLITCYGRTNFDIPAALMWAKQNKDRIVIEHAK